MEDIQQDRASASDDAGAAMSTLATTGWWRCDLATEELTWSDPVYDLFGFPRGSVLQRAETAARYTPESRIALECLRLAAIRDKTGFTLDAELAFDSTRRWIRIVAQVECIDGKATHLVGWKSDVTHAPRIGLSAEG